MVEKEVPGDFFKRKVFPHVGCSVAGLALMAILGGSAVAGYQGRVNYVNAIETERDILKEKGLLGEHSLISWNAVSGSVSSSVKDYLIASEVKFGGKKIKVAKIKLEVRGNDGITQYVEFTIPKENIKPIVVKDPNAKPAVLLKPENFVKQSDLGIIPIKKIIPSYILFIKDDNFENYIPSGIVTVLLSRKDNNIFKNTR